MTGPAASGHLVVPFTFPGEVPMRLDLDRLHFGERVAGEDGGEDPDPRKLPAIRVDLRDFVFDKRRFGHVQAELARGTAGMTLNHFTMTHPAFKAEGRGSWLVREQRAECRFEFVVESGDVLEFMDAMQLGTLVAAQARAHFGDLALARAARSQRARAPVGTHRDGGRERQPDLGRAGRRPRLRPHEPRAPAAPARARFRRPDRRRPRVRHPARHVPAHRRRGLYRQPDAARFRGRNRHRRPHQPQDAHLQPDRGRHGTARRLARRRRRARRRPGRRRGAPAVFPDLQGAAQGRDARLLSDYRVLGRSPGEAHRCRGNEGQSPGRAGVPEGPPPNRRPRRSNGPARSSPPCR